MPSTRPFTAVLSWAQQSIKASSHCPARTLCVQANAPIELIADKKARLEAKNGVVDCLRATRKRRCKPLNRSATSCLIAPFYMLWEHALLSENLLHDRRGKIVPGMVSCAPEFPTAPARWRDQPQRRHRDPELHHHLRLGHGLRASYSRQTNCCSGLQSAGQLY